jgi:NAD(P)-dependent dehydrogenase (short-subunit alcohol dehydrogenase family)
MTYKKLIKLTNYKNKTVLITGSSGQLGQHMVSLFRELGARVYGMDIVKPKNDRLINKNFIKGDVSDQKVVNSCLRKVFKIEKKIDIIINNAGSSVFTNYLNRSKEEIQNVVNTNLTGTINFIKEFSKFHKKKKFGYIINISSIYGVKIPNFEIYEKNDRINSEIYGASKSGVIQLTKYFAKILAKNKMIINCISPGGIINKKLQTKKFIKRYNFQVPLKRMAKVDDFNLALIYFSNDQNTYTTGQNLVIDGGFTI